MGTHIVFGSDDDGDDEGNEQQAISAVTVSKKSLFMDSQSNNGDMVYEAITAKEKAERKEKVCREESV